MFTSPHITSPLRNLSSTMNLSLGERPVYFPVSTVNAPFAASLPSPRIIACSTSTGTERLRNTLPRLVSPSFSRPKAIHSPLSCLFCPSEFRGAMLLLYLIPTLPHLIHDNSQHEERTEWHIHQSVIINC